MDNSSLRSAIRHLCKADPVMRRLIEMYEPVMPPAAAANRQPYFHTLIQGVINQQLSVKAGQTIGARLRARQGGRHFSAKRLVRLSSVVLRDCGISRSKTRYIQALARAVASGELNFRTLVNADDDAVRNTLMGYPGIGRWSADLFLMFALYRTDVLPFGDLALRKSMQRYYRLADNAGENVYLGIAEPWRPYRSIASRYLWAAAK